MCNNPCSVSYYVAHRCCLYWLPNTVLNRWFILKALLSSSKIQRTEHGDDLHGAPEKEQQRTKDAAPTLTESVGRGRQSMGNTISYVIWQRQHSVWFILMMYIYIMYEFGDIPTCSNYYIGCSQVATAVFLLFEKCSRLPNIGDNYKGTHQFEKTKMVCSLQSLMFEHRPIW